MDIVESVRPLAAILTALIGACLIMLTGRRPNVRETVSFVTAVVMFCIIASMIGDVAPAPLGLGHTLHLTLFPILPGLSVSFRADAFSMVFALVGSFLWIITVFYAAGYMRGLNEHAQTRFSACFALTLFGAMGVAFADNLFTLYLFYEVVSVCTYPLVAHHQDAEGYDGARKYIVYLTTTAKGLVLPAMIVIYVLTGNLDFAHNSHTGILSAGASDALATVLYVCCILGFAKNGIMPFHHWLPGAMEMPAHSMGILLVLLASTLLNVAYFAPVTYKAFFGKRPEGEETGIREAPLSMVVPILIAAGVSVFIGIYPDAIMSFVKVVTG